MSLVSKYALNSAHVTSRVPILNGATFPGSPGSATASKVIDAPGMATFSGGGACGARRRTTGISASMDQLLSLGRMNVGHLRPDLVEIERSGLEEGMGHVDLERARSALLQRRADVAVVVAVRQDGVDD